MTDTADRHTIRYRVLNPVEGNPEHEVTVLATAAEIDALVDDGYFVREGWFSAEQLSTFAGSLDGIADAERTTPDPRVAEYGGWQYLRFLERKHPMFAALPRFEPLVTIAKAVLGPVLRLDEVVGKYGHPKVAGQFVPWHIHMRLIPVPAPPFFSYPHAIHVFLNIDPIDAENGQFCLLPGSHRFTRKIYRQDDVADLDGQRILSLPAGSCLVMHANLWHRTTTSTAHGGPRRVLLFGYMPAWMSIEERRDNAAQLTAEHALQPTDVTMLELFETFYA